MKELDIEAPVDNLDAVLAFVDEQLAKEDPDVTIPTELREIGGLGIFLVKKTMDDGYWMTAKSLTDLCEVIIEVKRHSDELADTYQRYQYSLQPDESSGVKQIRRQEA